MEYKNWNKNIFLKPTSIQIEQSNEQVYVKVVATKKEHLNWSFRPAFEREKQFHYETIAIEHEKYKINLNKQIFIGTNILDLSKALMQDFHYNYIIRWWRWNVIEICEIMWYMKLKLKMFLKNSIN